jgi:hypothetical protein
MVFSDQYPLHTIKASCAPWILDPAKSFSSCAKYKPLHPENQALLAGKASNLNSIPFHGLFSDSSYILRKICCAYRKQGI